jgi:multidrug efflux pump subunit AcrB
VTGQVVLAPLLFQINGVEGMDRLEAVAGNTGSADIIVGLKEHADPVKVRELVKRRVALASPQLPVEVLEPTVATVERNAVAVTVAIALVGEGQVDLHGWADAVAGRLKKDKAAGDVEVWPGSDRTWVSVRLDREKAAELGVKVSDLLTRIEKLTEKEKNDPEKLRAVAVASRAGVEVRLEDVATFEKVTGPDEVAFIGMETCIKIFAKPPEGKTNAEAAAACLKIAREERMRLRLPESFRVLDLSDVNPASQLPLPSP